VEAILIWKEKALMVYKSAEDFAGTEYLEIQQCSDCQSGFEAMTS